jgi:hypothetical protein
MKICPAVVDCSLRADMTNLIVAFLSSENTPNNGKTVYWIVGVYSPFIVEVYIVFCNKYLCLMVFNI